MSRKNTMRNGNIFPIQRIISMKNNPKKSLQLIYLLGLLPSGVPLFAYGTAIITDRKIDMNKRKRCLLVNGVKTLSVVYKKMGVFGIIVDEHTQISVYKQQPGIKTHIIRKMLGGKQ